MLLTSTSVSSPSLSLSSCATPRGTAAAAVFIKASRGISSSSSSSSSSCCRVSKNKNHRSIAFSSSFHRRLNVVASAAAVQEGVVIQQYGDKVSDEETKKGFNSGELYVANFEQGRVLWDDGWVFLDIRNDQEREFFGKLPNPPKGTIGGVSEVVVVSGPECVANIPLVTSTGYRFDSTAGGKAFQNQHKNENFIAEVEKRFPDKKAAKIVVVCSDGRQRAVHALDMLDEAGYEKLVLLKGGFNLYNRGWDGKLKRRMPHGEFCSDYGKPGDVQQFSRGDKAGNANDAIEFGPWQDTTDWKPVLEGGSSHIHGHHEEPLKEMVLHDASNTEHDSFDEDDETVEKAARMQREKEEEEEKARIIEAELKAKAEAELKAKAEAELKAKAEAELKAKAEAELKAKAEAELKAKAEAELKAKAEAELKAKVEAEAKAKAEAEAEAARVKAEEERLGGKKLSCGARLYTF
ncbi:unnamed protein product [Bathycoccus prasinos]